MNKTKKSMSSAELNEIVKQYEALVNKLTKQFVDKMPVAWNDVKSMAYEGLAIAINSYDEERSDMSFAQYAGFAIRNNILTSLNNELRTVKLSAYAQKKCETSGDAVFNTVSLDVFTSEKQNSTDNIISGVPKHNDWSNLSTSDKWSDGDIFETLYSKLEEHFPSRDCEIFYMTFGLKEYNETKGKDIAEYFGISRSLVSIKVKSIISFIQKDNDLVEILGNLLK